jgi:serine/threonine protein kinase
MDYTKCIANKYKIDNCIGNGSFSNVYKGHNIKNNEIIAIKLEDKRTPYKLLKHETTILKYLHEHSCRHIPYVSWFGNYDNYMGLVMTHYECSLYDYMNSKNVSENKINSIIIQCIRIIESIHVNFVIHRDIKPHNFMLKNGELYLIDFGLSTFYINEQHIHISNTITDNIVGTPIYISNFIHEGNTPSRRDDIISIGYIYILLYAQHLPWDSLYNNDTDNTNITEINILHDKNIQRKAMKSYDSIIQTCSNINDRIVNYFKICFLYEFIDKPNYDFLCSTIANNAKIIN